MIPSKIKFSSKPKHIMVLTGEPSGDLHAGHLVRQIIQLDNRIYFSGIGGPHLEKMNVDLFFNIEKLSAMGLTEVLLQFAQIKKAFDLFKDKIRTTKPDLIILVDYPGFNLKAAQYVKKYYNIKILYYITPKVWAWKKSRIKKIKKYVDHAALILPFEKKIFKKACIPSTYVGNPLMDEYPQNVSKPFHSPDRLSAKKDQPLIIGLLPGSRKAEIKNLFKIMIKAADLIHQNNQAVGFIISQAGSIKKECLETILINTSQKKVFQINAGSIKDIFLKSDLVIAASGTVTLEAALCCVPTVIIYKMSPISYQLAKLVVKIKYAGLANLIVNQEVMPELLQNNATPEKIKNTVLYMLEHLIVFQDQLKMVRRFLGKKGASKRTAHIAIHMLKESQV